MGKWLLVLVLCLVEPADRCPDAPLEGVSSVGCRIKQESHGWKLWLQLGYTKGTQWERVEKPPNKEFWDSDSAAFTRCSEWRACMTRKLLAHQEAQRRNKCE